VAGCELHDGASHRCRPRSTRSIHELGRTSARQWSGEEVSPTNRLAGDVFRNVRVRQSGRHCASVAKKVAQVTVMLVRSHQPADFILNASGGGAEDVIPTRAKRTEDLLLCHAVSTGLTPLVVQRTAVRQRVRSRRGDAGMYLPAPGQLVSPQRVMSGRARQ